MAARLKHKKLAAILQVGVLAFCATAATADSSVIMLYPAVGSSMVFSGNNSPDEILLDLGACVEGTCTLSGTATGQGTLDSTGEWKYVTIRRLALFIESSLSSGSSWTVFGNSTFCYSSLVGCEGMVFLQGTASPSELLQTNETGVLTATLSGVSGTLERQFASAGGTASFNFVLPPSTSLTSLLNEPSSSTLTASLSPGAISPVPEPTSVALLVTGLLALSGILRPWKRAAS